MDIFRNKLILYILILAAVIRAVSMGPRILSQITADEHYHPANSIHIHQPVDNQPVL